MLIRRAQAADASAIWAILQPIIRAGETYALPRDMAEADALRYWLGADRQTFVAEDDGRILGTYYLKPNQLGGGAHVANCGYAVAQGATGILPVRSGYTPTIPSGSGRGIGRAMAEHSLQLAKEQGYRAMQFNFVVSTNDRAVRLWQRLGFQIIGTIPAAFAHPTEGDVDAHIMHRLLTD